MLISVEDIELTKRSQVSAIILFCLGAFLSLMLSVTCKFSLHYIANTCLTTQIIRDVSSKVNERGFSVHTIYS